MTEPETQNKTLALLLEKDEQKKNQLTQELEKKDFQNFNYEKKLAEIKSEDNGKRIKFKVQIQSISDIKQVPIQAYWQCIHCEQLQTTNYDLKKDFPILLQEKKWRHPPQTCQCGRKDFHMHDRLYANCYAIEAIDPLASFENEKEIKKNRHPKTIYLITEKLFDFARGVVELVGDVVLLGKQEVKKPAILTQTIKPLDEYFANYKPTQEDEKKFSEHFKAETTEQLENLLEKIDRTIAPLIVGRSNAKTLAAIAQHSPLYQNHEELGIIRVMFAGDSRCGKSEIGRDITKNLSPLGAEYVIAETASRTGISYAIDESATGEKIIRWGVLPQCDGGLATLDGLHSWDKESIMQLRETLAQGLVQVTRVLKGQTDARVRLIGITNLDENVFMYANRFLATKGSQILNNVDRNRWDWIYVFGEDDISHEKITESHSKHEQGHLKRAIPQEIWRKHVAWAWNLKPENLTFPEEFENEIGKDTNALLDKYNQCQSKPFSNEFYKNYRKMVLATHILTHSFENNEIKPSNAIRCFVGGFLEKLLLENLEFGDVMSLEVEKDEETEKIKTELLSSNNLCLIFKEVVLNNVKIQKTVVDKFKLQKSNVSDYFSKLEGLGLIEKRKGEYTSTVLGMKLWKKAKVVFEGLKV
ncbi:MAG: hypothetical protein ACE5DI_01265 [Candidatus Micrarchaeia archaeon]